MILTDLFKDFFKNLTPEQFRAIITIVIVLVALLIFTIVWLVKMPSLNTKARKVGDGQHGNARWITPKEKKKAYKKIEYDVESWRKGENLPPPKNAGVIIDMERKNDKIYAFVETHDVHVGMFAGTSAGKTAHFLYPNLEYACACGMSFFTTDTKGDLYRNYGFVAKTYYGYNVSVLDLRNPVISNGNNILAQVNKYMDFSKDLENDEAERLAAKAKAEKYAAMISENIVRSDRNQNYGANQYFYDAATGLLTATILLTSEFGEKEERHIASVFTLLTELLEQVKKGKDQYELRLNGILRRLPVEHRARLCAIAATKGGENTNMSVVTTALTKLIRFNDSEMEQMLCFENDIDIEKFCKEKSAIFVVLPEEDPTKYFLVSLLIQQFYRECLIYANSLNNRLPKRVIFYLDEIGTIPKIEGLDMMFSAMRSRNMLAVPIIQDPAQFEDKYGEKSAQTIKSNIACVLYGGFAPESKLAHNISKALGNVTVSTGSVSRNSFKVFETNISTQMTGKPLISEEELNRFKTGEFIVRRSGQYPMKAKLELFLDWGITFPEQLIPKEKKLRPVKYLKAQDLELRILNKYPSPPQPPQKQKFKHPGRPTVVEYQQDSKSIQDMMQIPADSVTAAVCEYEGTSENQNKKSSKLTKKSDIKV